MRMVKQLMIAAVALSVAVPPAAALPTVSGQPIRIQAGDAAEAGERLACGPRCRNNRRAARRSGRRAARRHDRRHYRRHARRHHHHHHYHRRDNRGDAVAAGLAAGIIGLGIGAAIANSANTTYAPPPGSYPGDYR